MFRLCIVCLFVVEAIRGQGLVNSNSGNNDNFNPADCLLPPEGGLCRAYFPMYYFDAASGTCKDFVYGGCDGNNNRHWTQEICMNRCSVMVQTQSQPVKVRVMTNTEPFNASTCLLQPDSGRCKAYFPMYYFDPRVGTCVDFIYGGCEGNGNRFVTVEDCIGHCVTKAMRITRTVNPICRQAPDTGCSLLSFFGSTKYSFDAQAGSCVPIRYCGNDVTSTDPANIFASENDCKNQCIIVSVQPRQPTATNMPLVAIAPTVATQPPAPVPITTTEVPARKLAVMGAWWQQPQVAAQRDLAVQPQPVQVLRGLSAISHFREVGTRCYGDIIERLYLRSPDECAEFCDRYMAYNCNAFTTVAGMCYLKTECVDDPMRRQLETVGYQTLDFDLAGQQRSFVRTY